jgi:integrase
MRAWRHPNGWWYGVQGGKREALKTKDRDTALQRVKDLESVRSKPRGSAIKDIVEAYLDDKASLSSHPKMLDAWKALKPIFGHLRPDQIGRDECRGYVRRRSGRSHGTIRKELGVLQAAVRWAGHREFKCELPPAPPPRDTFITKREFERLLNAAKAHHVKTFLMLAWYTAARKEAVLSLKWSNVDFGAGRINLGVGSGNKGRATVPMAPALRSHLKDAFDARGTDYVVEWGGGRVASIRRGFSEALTRAKMPGSITPHDLRRSAARRMVEGGASIHEVAQILGHSNITTTFKVYARFGPKHLKKAISKL